VLFELLRAVGFEVERRLGIVGPRESHQGGAPVNHMALVVHTDDGEPFIADAGLGEGPVDPLPLRPGAVRAGAFEYTIEPDGDGWWVGQHEFGSYAGYRFGAPATRTREVLADPAAFAAALEQRFGIDPAALGDEPLAHLWRKAAAQHEAHVLSAPA
jgi:N-hydroxyarylamine O-acetyltransferase